VICCVLVTERSRRRMSIKEAIAPDQAVAAALASAFDSVFASAFA